MTAAVAAMTMMKSSITPQIWRVVIRVIIVERVTRVEVAAMMKATTLRKGSDFNIQF